MPRYTSHSHGPLTLGQQAATSGVNLTKVKVEEMFDRQILIEMLLWTVKLEISHHVTSKFAKLREFISTFLPSSGSTTTTATIDVYNESRVSGNLPQGMCVTCLKAHMNKCNVI